MVHVFRSCLLLRSIFAAASEFCNRPGDLHNNCPDGIWDVACWATCDDGESKNNSKTLFVDLKDGSKAILEGLTKIWVGMRRLRTMDIALSFDFDGGDLTKKTDLDPDGFQIFSNALPQKLKHLGLDFARANMTDAMATDLADGLPKVRPMRSLMLDLGYTDLTDAGIAKVALSLSKKLKTLHLNFADLVLRGGGIRALQKSWSKQEQLKSLHLHPGKITDDGIQKVVSFLPKKLITLVMTVESEYVRDASASIGYMFEAPLIATKLQSLELHLQGTQITDAGIEAIQEVPSPLGKFSSLTLGFPDEVTVNSLNGLKERLHAKGWKTVDVYEYGRRLLATMLEASATTPTVPLTVIP